GAHARGRSEGQGEGHRRTLRRGKGGDRRLCRTRGRLAGGSRGARTPLHGAAPRALAGVGRRDRDPADISVVRKHDFNARRTSMKVANPYLNFDGKAEEAFQFYRSVFGGEFTNVTRFRDMGGQSMGMSGKELDGIANIGLPLGANNILMASDV